MHIQIIVNDTRRTLTYIIKRVCYNNSSFFFYKIHESGFILVNFRLHCIHVLLYMKIGLNITFILFFKDTSSKC
jgi:hypothetical protein